MAGVPSVTAKVKRLYLDKTGCRIELKNPSVHPQNGYFFLGLTHPNYKSLYALAMLALANKYDLTIRVDAPSIDPSKNDIPIEYLVVDN